MIDIGNDWQPFFDAEQSKPYYEHLRKFLIQEYYSETVYPPKELIFNAFKLTPFSEVKVVIIGQDPYHSAGQAMGLSFSVPATIKEPPSLRNIHKELLNEGFECNDWSRDLTRWAEQGVLLLNSTLTVREHQPTSHCGYGWEELTDGVLRKLNNDDSPKVFILWGNNAKQKKTLITNQTHLILESAHPSPLSARNGFFGNNHFRKANEYLKHHGLKEIDW